ncbi:MAG: DEAD/DEAH box helicase [Anaerolineales bacterium]|nr:DEAD/DEAH box helicase [Anaerolineales bacterium]
MSINQLLSHWRSEPSIGGNIEDWRIIPARFAQTTAFPRDINIILKQAAYRMGISDLYSHQYSSWEKIQSGKNVVVVTGTASGKTLCYNLPVLNCILSDPKAKALYLFPTKALGQDQRDELSNWINCLDTNLKPIATTYDGDTPQHSRTNIRKKANIILSNPDMLHMGILPYHTRWADFFENLRYVVIDEMHAYRGVFGSHVANVVRRLKRVADFYGSHPQFILTSATIANPIELGSKLIEDRVSLVADDGSPRGEKHFIMYNPPVVDPDLGIRASVLQESVRLSSDIITCGSQTLIFAVTRRTIELMLNYLRSQALVPRGQIQGYRSGYLPHERRAIENGLRSGEIRAVVSTNALELGVDIGSVEATVITGYPGTIASLWQQAGRSGRKNETSLTVFLTSSNPLDQFLAANPEYLFSRSPEQALINPDNLLILLSHILCASFELPFTTGQSFGNVSADQVQEFLEYLENSEVLYQAGDKYFWMAQDYPASSVSLRTTSPDSVLLHSYVDGSWKIIGEVDSNSAHWMVHPEAIYLHRGQSYLVESLDINENIARLVPVEVDYYTQSRSETEVSLLESYSQVQAPGAKKGNGQFNITTKVTGYKIIQWYTNNLLNTGSVDLPEKVLQTSGYWICPDSETVEVLTQEGLWNLSPNDYGPNWETQKIKARQRDGNICQICGTPEKGRSHDVHHKIPFRTFSSYNEANHLRNLVTLCSSCHKRAEAVVRIRSGLAGLAFVLSNLAPLFLMCDPTDLDVYSDPAADFTEGNPVVLIYERIPTGIGFSERLFELHDEILLRALELVTHCKCKDGCPSCVGPGGESGSGSKKETLALLKILTHNQL